MIRLRPVDGHLPLEPHEKIYVETLRMNLIGAFDHATVFNCWLIKLRKGVTSMAKKPVDIEKANFSPASVFETPESVLEHAEIPMDEKIEILRRWEYDASENCVAVEEGMPGGESDLLRRILLALNQLTGGVDVEKVASSKQHGISSSAIKPK